jgi:aspartate/methionine/tyrosine aminotransferase
MPHSWLANRTAAFDSSGIRKVFDLAAKMADPINLSIGQPDFDVPEPVAPRPAMIGPRITRLLTALLASDGLTEKERLAFRQMDRWGVRGRLSPKQRAWIEGVASSLGVEVD